MAEKTVYARVRNLVQSSTDWSTSNPTLLDGEVGIESDTGKFKVGDGTKKWNSLAYSKVLVVNALNSDSEVDPLSAKQGKELKTTLDTKYSGISTGIDITFTPPAIAT